MTNAATETETPAAKPPVAGLLCPHCLDADARVLLDVGDMATMPTAECQSCGEAFAPRTAALMFQCLADRWDRLADFLAGAPKAGA
jgi:hypothetical protein